MRKSDAARDRAFRALAHEDPERYRELLDVERIKLGLKPMSEVQGGRRVSGELPNPAYRECEWCGKAVVYNRMAIHKLEQCPNREED